MSRSKQSYKYLFANILAFLCGNFGTKLISFVMVPLYTNILTPAEYGEIDLILSVAGVLSPFIACGIHEGIMRFCLDKDADHKLVFSIGMRVFLISSAVFLAVTPLLRYIPVVSDNAAFLYAYCILNELMTILLCYIRGKDNIKLYTFLGFLSALLTASLNILFLVGLHWGLLGYKVSMLISPVLTSLGAILIGKILPDFVIRKWNKSLAKEMLQYSMILIPNAILWWCIDASDRFFVSYICGAAENGLYAVAYKLPTVLSTVASIFMQAWQMSAIREHEEGSDSTFSASVYRYLTFFVGLATLSLMLVNKFVLSIYVGDNYFRAWMYSPPLMLSFFVGALATFWGSFYIAEKKMKKYLCSAIAGAVVNIVLNFLLISQMGTIGAAIATTVSYIVVFAVRGFGICKSVQMRVVNLQVATSFVCLGVGLLASYLPGIWAWVIGLINIGVYVLLNQRMLSAVAKTAISMLRKIRPNKG